MALENFLKKYHRCKMKRISTEFEEFSNEFVQYLKTNLSADYKISNINSGNFSISGFVESESVYVHFAYIWDLQSEIDVFNSKTTPVTLTRCCKRHNEFEYEPAKYAAIAEVPEKIKEMVLEKLGQERPWVNYGDVNFLEHGGAMVRPAYEKDIRDKYKTLAYEFEVFRLENIAGEEDKVLAYLKYVDLYDWNDSKNMEEIENEFGECPTDDLPLWASYCAEKEGLQPTVDRAKSGAMYPQDQDYILTRKEAEIWMEQLGIPYNKAS